MEVQKQLTDDAREILTLATRAASLRQSPYVDVEHILLGMLQLNPLTDPLQRIMAEVDRPRFEEKLSAELGMIRDEASPNPPILTAQGKVVLEEAARHAQVMGFRFLNGGHLLLGLYPTRSELVHQLLDEMGLQASQIIQATKSFSPAPTQAAPMPQLVLIDHRANYRKPRAPRTSTEAQISPYAPYMLAAFAGLMLYLFLFQPDKAIGFSIIFGGWIFSLTLHEYSHALVAYMGGDHTVKDKGYLRFNPLYYTDPIFSIVIPIIFLMLGGLGLPGGAVYIEEHRLRSPMWRVAVSLAGPASNAFVALILSTPFILGFIEPSFASLLDGANQVQAGLAFLIFLQVTAVFFNLIPIPPLDGFNAISPFLPPEMERSVRQIGMISLFLLFYLFQVDSFAREFFQAVHNVTDFLNVPWDWVVDGLDVLRFW